MTNRDDKPSNRELEIRNIAEQYKKTKDNALQKEISDFSNMSPEVVAQLIRNWINSDE